MRYLLDTHIALWITDDSQKTPAAVREIANRGSSDLYVSDISLWEIAIKHLQRPSAMKYSAKEYEDFFERAHFKPLHLNRDAIMAYESLDISKAKDKHRDPFDRMLIAQAKAEEMLLLTHDAAFSLYGEPWVMVV